MPWALTCWSVGAGGLDEGPEGAHLVTVDVLDLLRAHVHAPPAEAHEVGQAGVRPDGHAVREGELDGLAHHVRVAAVEAAGDVGRRDVGHDVLVAPQGPAAVALAHVAVDVDVDAHIFAMTPWRSAPPGRLVAVRDQDNPIHARFHVGPELLDALLGRAVDGVLDGGLAPGRRIPLGGQPLAHVLLGLLTVPAHVNGQLVGGGEARGSRPASFAKAWIFCQDLVSSRACRSRSATRRPPWPRA